MMINLLYFIYRASNNMFGRFLYFRIYHNSGKIKKTIIVMLKRYYILNLLKSPQNFHGQKTTDKKVK